MIEMTCEKCGSLYELTEDEFEERAERKANDLCPVCLEDEFEEQREKPVKRCFEYLIISLFQQAQEDLLNKLGKDGWELIAVTSEENYRSQHAYLKRKYFKEA